MLHVGETLKPLVLARGKTWHPVWAVANSVVPAFCRAPPFFFSSFFFYRAPLWHWWNIEGNIYAKSPSAAVIPMTLDSRIDISNSLSNSHNNVGLICDDMRSCTIDNQWEVASVARKNICLLSKQKRVSSVQASFEQQLCSTYSCHTHFRTSLFFHPGIKWSSLPQLVIQKKKTH